MSIQRVQRKNVVVWAVRWRDASGRQRSRVFDRKRDAAIFEAEVKRRARLGDLAAMDAGREVLDDYVTKTWGPSHAAHLAPRTRQTYASTYNRHISPELGGVPLREIDAERVAVFQGKLVRAGVGPHAIRKAMMLLGAILQRAAEGRRIAYNPQRVVRRAPLPMADEVRPLAPITIERMRAAAASEREAAIVSVLGYAGLRPGELRILRWSDVRGRTLLVTAEKTRRRRTVRLLEPLADDLRAWRRQFGNPADGSLVFPGDRGGVWTANAFEKWRRRRFGSLLAAAGLVRGRPYDLRHSFASLLLHEGRDVIYVARQLGHGAELTLRTYGHVIEELEDSPQLPAEEAIRQAREALRLRRDLVRVLCAFLETRRAATAANGAVVRRPELDSNQRPTP
jgi:integrase